MDGEPVKAAGGMVVSTDAYASTVGVRILEAGGNAVDAAVATSFALAVVNPEAGNIGGGGFMLIRFADGEAAALDYRERAPLAAHRDMYLDAEGNLTDASTTGHRAVGVPGAVAGLWAAHQRYGALPHGGVFLFPDFTRSKKAFSSLKLSGIPETCGSFSPRLLRASQTR